MDKYISFKYKGVSSLDYNAYIVNEGSDLRFSNAPSFNNEFAFPKFGSSNILLGVNKESRTINLRLVLVKVDIKKYKGFLRWLNIESSGDLQFGYNLNYAYNVKVSSISDGTFYVIKDIDCDLNNPLYNVELDISFVTVGDYAAKWVATSPKFTFPFISPEDWIDSDETDSAEVPEFISSYAEIIPGPGFNVTLYNNHHIENFYKIEFTDGIEVKNASNGDTLYKVSSGAGTIYTQYGICLNNGQFVNMANNIGTLYSEPKSNLPLHILIQSGTVKIYPVSREII